MVEMNSFSVSSQAPFLSLHFSLSLFLNSYSLIPITASLVFVLLPRLLPSCPHLSPFIQFCLFQFLLLLLLFLLCSSCLSLFQWFSLSFPFFGLARLTLWLHCSPLNHSHSVSLPFSLSLICLCHPAFSLPNLPSFSPPHTHHIALISLSLSHTVNLPYLSQSGHFYPFPLLMPCL